MSVYMKKSKLTFANFVIRIYAQKKNSQNIFQDSTIMRRITNVMFVKSYPQVHRKFRDHKCHIWGKEFGQSTTLKTHISSIHEKVSQCDLCKEEFRHKTHLNYEEFYNELYN